MLNDVIIRPYKLSDRSAVRQICCDTADRGGPVESIFFDRATFADLLMNYYTDFESAALWIADYKGQVVGYLAGCLDTQRYNQLMLWYVVPNTIIRAIIRGVLLRIRTWRILKSLLRSWQLGGFKRNIPLDKYPAHLHVNVKENFRGQHIGRRLIERFLRQVKAAGLKGIHLTVNEKNASACRFFEQMGFTALSRHPMSLPSGDIPQIKYTAVYVKQL